MADKHLPTLCVLSGGWAVFGKDNVLFIDQGKDQGILQRRFEAGGWPEAQTTTIGLTYYRRTTTALAISCDSQYLAIGGGYVPLPRPGHVGSTGPWPVDLILREVEGRGVRLEREEIAFSNTQAIAFSPDEKLLASGGEHESKTPPGLIMLHDTATGKQHSSFVFKPGCVHSLAFSPDGKYLTAAGIGEDLDFSLPKVVMWDMATGKVWREIIGHDRAVNAVAFSPDGLILATGGDDAAVFLWHVPTGKQLALLEGHKPPVYAIAFSPDGTKLAYTCAENAIYLWDLTKVVQYRVR